MRYFIVHTVPKDFIEKYKTSISGGNFTYNLIEAGLFDKTISILPTNVSHYSGPLIDNGVEIVYSNVRGSSFISRLLGCIIEQFKVFKTIKNGSTVWFYNLDILSIILFILLKTLKRNVKLYVVVADFSPGEQINNMILPLINRSNGIISLSNSDLFSKGNLRILPGIVPNNQDYVRISKPIERTFLISGALIERISCLKLLLDTFAKMPECILNISGRYDNIQLLEEYCKKYKNIRYHGVLNYSEFQTLLDSNTFILSTRDPSFPENTCNFPSKILEALLHNRIIISSIHYPQLDGIRYFEVSIDKDQFYGDITRIINMEENKLVEYANQAAIVSKLFSPEEWKKSLSIIEQQ